MKVVAGRGPYFIQVPFLLLDDPEIDAEGIATYCAIRRFTDFGSDKGCFASHKKLAAVAGLSIRTLKRRLEWLRDTGWVDWDNTKGRSNHYSVNNSRYPIPFKYLGQPDLPPQAPVAQEVGHPDPLPRDSDRETITESSKPAAWVHTLAGDWTKSYGGIPNYGELGKRLKPLIDSHGFEPVQEHWQCYLEATEGRYASPSRFAQTYGSWDRAGGAPAQEGRVSVDEARVQFRAAGIPDNWPVNPDGYESREQLNVALAARLAKLTGALV